MLSFSPALPPYHPACFPPVSLRRSPRCRYQGPCTTMARAAIDHAMKMHVIPRLTPPRLPLCLSQTLQGRGGILGHGMAHESTTNHTSELASTSRMGSQDEWFADRCKRVTAKVGQRKWPMCRVSITCKSGAQSEERSSRTASSSTTTSSPMEGDKHHRWCTTRDEPKGSRSWRMLESHIDCREHWSTRPILAIHPKNRDWSTPTWHGCLVESSRFWRSRNIWDTRKPRYGKPILSSFKRTTCALLVKVSRFYFSTSVVLRVSCRKFIVRQKLRSIETKR